jgi:tRNA 2-thiouridine synthesizing protein E
MTDDAGFIEAIGPWHKNWVEYTAEQECIGELTEDHWKVIECIREYYQEYGSAPMIKLLTKKTGFRLKYIYELFPSGPARGACKVAGLPKPTGCI